MRVCGIIAEYDPFHRGHRYHLETARAKSQADFVVCVLGCAFSQRGDAMLFDSHMRAEMALLNGADLVLGMPVSFSCAQANRFAKGGVGILHGIGVTTHLAFGSESTDLSFLKAAALTLNHPDESYITILKDNLASGMSFAKAQGEALQDHLGLENEASLSSPNLILGISYLRELERLNSGIIPLPIKRATDYHSKDPGPLASAGAVRRKLLFDPGADVSEECPDETARLIITAARHRPEALDKMLIYALLNQSPSRLREYSEFTEGLEQRALSAARQAVSREEVIKHIKTRRYPYARINRALTQALLGLKQEEQAPGYARLLGMKKSARALLNEIGNSRFPLVTRPARSRFPGIEQDMRAEEYWQIGAGNAAKTAWQKQVVILD